MEEKGHKCGQCLKTFPSSQQLAQHSLVHTNVRKYACAYCDKAFKQLSHVQQHQRIHTGLYPLPMFVHLRHSWPGEDTVYGRPM